MSIVLPPPVLTVFFFVSNAGILWKAKIDFKYVNCNRIPIHFNSILSDEKPQT